MKWECDWYQEKRNDSDIALYAQEDFFDNRFHPLKLYDSDTILKNISSNEIFGLCRVNIFTPTYLKDMFAEFPPIFKKTTITLNDVGEHMKSIAIDHGLRESTKRKNLILSYYGINIWLISPLVKWYLEKGLQIEVHEFVSFTPKACFKEYIDLVTEKRRLGDVDKDSSLIAEQMKLLANSSFGKFITNCEGQFTVTFGNSNKARTKVNDPNFRKLEELDDDIYEINVLHPNVKLELPMVIGLFVLQEAKHIILRFIYDFLKVYFRSDDIQLLAHDTDSVYIAATVDNIEDLLHPCLREKYYNVERDRWFPTECCANHKSDYVQCKLEDKIWIKQPCCNHEYIRQIRTPGLFKEEFSGTKFIGLSPKCYFAYNEKKSKLSCKGVRKNNNLQYEDFEKIINRTESKIKCINRGFLSVKGEMKSYQQVKNGLTNLYFKRIVDEDNISTHPLLV